MGAGQLGEPPGWLAVADLVRDMTRTGALRPGDPVPSCGELAGRTGFRAVTCRRGLAVLLGEGLLVRGASPRARLRVAGAPVAAGAAALSAALAAGRGALGVRQPELAALLGVSVTTVAHAETGRLWQSRRFWAAAAAHLGDASLLVLYDEYRAAGPDGPETPGRGRPPVLVPDVAG